MVKAPSVRMSEILWQIQQEGGETRCQQEMELDPGEWGQ